MRRKKSNMYLILLCRRFEKKSHCRMFVSPNKKRRRKSTMDFSVIVVRKIISQDFMQNVRKSKLKKE